VTCISLEVVTVFVTADISAQDPQVIARSKVGVMAQDALEGNHPMLLQLLLQEQQRLASTFANDIVAVANDS
jgi:hypothetical protein